MDNNNGNYSNTYGEPDRRNGGESRYGYDASHSAPNEERPRSGGHYYSSSHINTSGQNRSYPNGQKHSRQRKVRWIDQIRRKGLIHGFSVISLFVIAPVFLLTAAFLIVFPRSKVSVLEKRELAQFPRFSVSSLFSGQFTEDVGNYYDDTVPYRDFFKTAGYKFKNIFGLHTEDEIIVIGAPTKVPANPGKDTSSAVSGSASSSSVSSSAVSEASSSASSSSSELSSSSESVSSEDVSYVSEDPYNGEDPEVADYSNIVLAKQGGHWRALELFGGGGGDSYAAAINAIHQELGSSVTVYSMIDPLSSEYYMPPSYADYSASQNDCIDEINAKLDAGIVGINIAPVLSHHTKEYIYLRTDHHWAPLGAYYAAETFAKAAGVDFKDLSTYTPVELGDYVGSMYGWTGNAVLLADPDEFTYYVPSNYEKCTTYYYDTDFNFWDTGNFFNIVDSESSAYLTFMGSDELTVKVKTDVHNGRKLVIVKDSYGNAIPSFLFGSFEEIYVTDMRYFGCNLVDFVKQTGATDLLFTMTAFSAVGNGGALEDLRVQYKGYPIVDGALTASSEPEGSVSLPESSETE